MCIPISKIRGVVKAIFLSLGFTLGLLFSGFAQTNPANSLDDIYTPPVGSVLLSGDLKSKSNSKPDRSGEALGSNFISWDGGMAFRGALALSYGRVFKSRFGLEVGLGASIIGDYIANYSHKLVVASNEDEPYYTDSEAANFQYYNSYPERAVRPYFHVKGLYFLREDPEEGPYVSLQYRFWQNSLVYGGDFPENDEFKELRTRYNISYHNINFAFGFRSSGSGESIHDYCIGLGYRMGVFPKVPVTRWDSFSQSPVPEDRVFQNALQFGSPSTETLSINRLVLVASYIWHVSF